MITCLCVESSESDHCSTTQRNVRRKILMPRKHTLTSTLRKRNHLHPRQSLLNKRQEETDESDFSGNSSDEEKISEYICYKGVLDFLCF